MSESSEWLNKNGKQLEELVAKMRTKTCTATEVQLVESLDSALQEIKRLSDRCETYMISLKMISPVRNI